MVKSNIIAYVVRPEFGTKDTWAVEWEIDSSADSNAVRTVYRGEALTAEQLSSLPKRFSAKKVRPPKDVPTDIIGHPSGPFLCSHKAKKLLERLEPDLHQFLEVNVFDRETSESYGKRHLLHLTTHLDCIDYEATQFEKGYGEQNGASSGFRPYPRTPMIVYQPVVEGHHFWRGGGRANGIFFISSQLAEFLKSEGVRGWQLEYCCVPSSKDTSISRLTRH